MTGAPLFALVFLLWAALIALILRRVVLEPDPYERMWWFRVAIAVSATGFAAWLWTIAWGCGHR